jgi:hypothetical protein
MPKLKKYIYFDILSQIINPLLREFAECKGI